MELNREDKAKMVWQFFSTDGRKHHFDIYEDDELEEFVNKDFDELDLYEKNRVSENSYHLYPRLSQQEDWKMFFED